MPSHALQQKELEAHDKPQAASSSGAQLTQATDTEKAPDKAAIMKRLMAQGAVSVFPFGRSRAKEEASPAAPELDNSEAEEQEKAEEPKNTAPEALDEAGGVDGGESGEQSSAGSGASESESGAAEGSGQSEAQSSAAGGASESGSDAAGGSGQSEEQSAAKPGESEEEFHARVQKQTDAVNNPKWYDVSQKAKNAYYGKWDLTQSRERSGRRKQDVNLEEDVRTNIHMGKLAPGTFDIKQKAKNAINDTVKSYKDDTTQTMAGHIPIVGSLIKQKLAERSEIRERDLHRGIAASSQNEEIRESSSSQAKAVHTKIQSDRAKAAVGSLTGGIGKLVPVPGVSQVASAAGAAAGLAIDIGTGDSRKQVTLSRAREMAQKDMGSKASHGFQGYEDYQALKKQAQDLSAVGQGKKGVTAPAIDSQDQVARLSAFQRGKIEHQSLYEKHYKRVEKERAAAAKAAEAANKPKEEGTGLLSKFKGLFKRSS